MSYYVRVDGELTVDPPLEWREIKTSPFLPVSSTGRPLARPVGRRGWSEEPDIKLVVATATVETAEGDLFRKTVTTVVPAWDESYQPARLVEDVRELLDAHPSHTFTGRFDCAGEQNGDLWRVEIRDGIAVKVRAVVLWPEDVEDLAVAASAYSQATLPGSPDTDVRTRGARLMDAAFKVIRRVGKES